MERGRYRRSVERRFRIKSGAKAKKKKNIGYSVGLTDVFIP